MITWQSVSVTCDICRTRTDGGPVDTRISDAAVLHKFGYWTLGGRHICLDCQRKALEAMYGDVGRTA